MFSEIFNYVTTFVFQVVGFCYYFRIVLVMFTLLINVLCGGDIWRRRKLFRLAGPDSFRLSCHSKPEAAGSGGSVSAVNVPAVAINRAVFVLAHLATLPRRKQFRTAIARSAFVITDTEFTHFEWTIHKRQIMRELWAARSLTRCHGAISIRHGNEGNISWGIL